MSAQCRSDAALFASYVAAQTSRLANLDVVSSTFLYDGTLEFMWRDDRVCPLYPAVVGRSMTGTPVPADDFASMWWPEPQLLNAGTPPGDGSLPSLTFEFTAYRWAEVGGTVFETAVVVQDVDSAATPEEEQTACWLLARSRLFLDVALHAQLKDFPYDSQDIGILFETQRQSSSDMRFRTAGPNYETLLPDSDVDGWTVVGAGGVSYEKYMPSITVAFPRIYLYVRLTRLASIYNLRFVAGTVLLNVLALMGMVLRGEWINDRLNLPLACFLGIVSWQFILVSSTPALGYATRMDNFLVMSLIFNTCIFATSASHILLWGYCGAAVKARLAHAEAQAGDVGAEPQCLDEIEEQQQPCAPPKLRVWDRAARAVSRYEALFRFFLASVAYLIASYYVLTGGLPKVETPVMRIETCPGGWNSTGVVHCNGGLNASTLVNKVGGSDAVSFKGLPDTWVRK